MAASEGWTTLHATHHDDTRAAETDLVVLAAEHAALLFRVAFAVVRSPAEAEDIVQDVFVRLLERTHLLAGVHDPRLWLIRITFNRAIDHRRRHRPDQLDPRLAHDLVAHTLPADQLLQVSEQITTVLREIDRLPRPERNALLLSANDELSPAEIAIILDRTPSATRALLHRARTRLLKRLSDPKKGAPR